VRLVVADDSVLMRQGVVAVLENAGFEVVAQAGDADDLVRKVGAHKPDVAIIDVRMPPDNTDDGLRAAIKLRAEHPDLRVLVLSQYVEPDYAQALLAGNAAGVGYLLKDRVSDVEHFIDAVERVAGGGSALDPEVVSHLVGRQQPDSPVERLTPREREVLELVAQGLSNVEIAELLVVEETTVKTHVSRLLAKLDLRDRVQAVIFAYESGLVES
jgi:DNA-binding NarL/FixJ family response regulator